MNTPDRDISKLNPKFSSSVKAWLNANPEIFLVEGWRSEERQKELIAKGLSKVKHSNHQDGLAVDIGFRDDPSTHQKETELYPQDMKRWRKVADSAKKYGIDWGYDLWSWDMPHFQISNQTIMPTITPQIPDWAKPIVEKAKQKGITTPLESKVSDLPLYQLLGVIEKYLK